MKTILWMSLFVGLAATIAGCSGRSGWTPAPGDDAVGTVGLQLQVAPGVSIRTLYWTIHNATLLSADRTGAVDVSHSEAIQFVVGGLPAGGGYTITLTATTDGPNALDCAGTADFAVVAHSTSHVVLNPVCQSAIDGGSNGSVVINGSATLAPSCAAVTALSASPSEVDVGSSLQLSAGAIDSAGVTSDVSLSWAVTGGSGTGSFSSPTSASPTFTCTGAGPVLVTVTASTPDGGDCTNNTASVSLTCDTGRPASACSNSDAGLGGIGVPSGTIATASAVWNGFTPDKTFDGSTGVGWNSGSTAGWMELAFPTPLALDGIQLYVGALPQSVETYTFTGFQGNNAISLGSFTANVINGISLLPAMPVAAGTYDAIRIDVQSSISWVSITEISILTPNCAEADGGSGGGVGSDTGTDDAGSVDASMGGNADTSADGAADGAGTTLGFSPPASLDGVELTTILSCSGGVSGLCGAGLQMESAPISLSGQIRWRATANPNLLPAGTKVFVDSVDPALSSVGVQGPFGFSVVRADSPGEYSIVEQLNPVGSTIAVSTYDVVVQSGALALTYTVERNHADFPITFSAPCPCIPGQHGTSTINNHFTITCTGVAGLPVDGGISGNGTVDGALDVAAEGNSDGSNSDTSGSKGAVAVAMGAGDTCAILTDHTAACWGSNRGGQLGNGISNAIDRCLPSFSTPDSATPVVVSGLGGVAGIALTSGGPDSGPGGFGSVSCAALSDGTVQCWGTVPQASIPCVPFNACSPSPLPESGLTGVTAVAAGQATVCALLSSGSVKCWLDNSLGQFGDSLQAASGSPLPVPAATGLTDAMAIAAGASHFCALRGGGTVECWGDNQFGQLGDGTTTQFTATPVAVNGLTGVTAIAAGGMQNCALLSDGTVACWGDNRLGQLGDGTTIGSAIPVAVSGLTGVMGIAVGNSHACAQLSGGTVTCWGDNSAGALGNGTTTSSSTPVPVAGLGGVASLAAGAEETCVVLSGGTVECWGLIHGTVSSSSTPVVISGL
jgi:Regulator of Chromosome Condensation (RCC1) repeat protein/regulator of chromosome condensation (RCC1) repeat-containing protein